MKALELSQKKQQDAASNLLAQQRLGMDQQRMQAENTRADAAGRREDRMASMAERQARMQAAQAVLPYLDPNSPQFNPQMAQSYGGALGVSVSQVPDNAQAPTAPAEPKAPAFTGPIPSEADARAGARPPPQAPEAASVPISPPDGGTPGGRMIKIDQPFGISAGPEGPRQDPAANAAAQEAMQQQMERDQYAQQLAEAPQRQAQYHQQIQDYQQRKQFPAFQMDLGDGKPMTVDTLAMHKQAEETRQLRVQKWAEALDGDREAMQVALPMAHLGVPDDKIAAYVQAHTEKQTARDEKLSEKDKFDLTAEQKWKLGVMNAQAHATSAQAGAGSKADAAAARAQSTLGQAEARAEKMVDWKGLVGMDNTVRSLMANIDSPNVLQSRDAQIQLGRVFRGTTPTEGEMKLLYDHLGGTADTWNQFVAHLENGGLSAEQARQVKASAATVNHEFERRKERAIGALKTGFGPGSGFEAMGPQVNAMLKSHGQALGVDIPDLYDTTDAGPGAVVLGSRGKRSPAAKPAGNPLTDAAKLNARNQKIQQMAPADKAAVDWADKHPHDPRAAQILQLHGL
jgi:hypothetical protein